MKKRYISISIIIVSVIIIIFVTIKHRTNEVVIENIMTNVDKCIIEENYSEAIKLLNQAKNITDDKKIEDKIELLKNCNAQVELYNSALLLMNKEEYENALCEFEKIGDEVASIKENSKKKADECKRKLIETNLLSYSDEILLDVVNNSMKKYGEIYLSINISQNGIEDNDGMMATNYYELKEPYNTVEKRTEAFNNIFASKYFINDHEVDVDTAEKYISIDGKDYVSLFPQLHPSWGYKYGRVLSKEVEEDKLEVKFNYSFGYYSEESQKDIAIIQFKLDEDKLKIYSIEFPNMMHN